MIQFFGCRSQGNVAEELVPLVGLVLGNALHFGSMETVEYVRILQFLRVDALGSRQRLGQGIIRTATLTPDVTDHPAQKRAQLLHFVSRPVRLPSMAVAPAHDQGLLGKSSITLTRMIPRFPATRARDGLALWYNRSSVEKAMAFSCTGVSTFTRYM